MNRKQYRILILLVLLCALLAASALAEEGELPITGRVYEDINGDGVMDENDQPVEGVTVHAVNKKTGDAYEAVSDADGYYTILVPVKGTYTMTADLPEGLIYTRYTKTGGDLRSIFTRSDITRDFNVTKSGLANRNIGVVQQGAIYGWAFLDENYNGIRDEGEPGYAGVTVEIIKNSNDTTYGKVTTDKDGYFIVENLRGGDYRVRAILPDDGSIFSCTGSGDCGEVNLFEQKNGRRENTVTPITVTSGSQKQAIIGVALGATVTGKVFEDKDYSGTLNGKENAITGIRVQAVAEDGSIAAEASSVKKGVYKLTGLMPGRYTIRFQRKAGYGFTRCRAGEANGSHVQTIEDGWGVCETITIAMNETKEDINAGQLPAATVSGRLVHDSNDNASADTDESGFTQASVRLWSEEAEMDFTVTPEADGSFCFTGVMPGTYDLEYLLPEHAEMTLGDERQAAVVTVKAGEEYELETACAVELGSYEGSVKDTQGRGVAGAVLKIGDVRAESDENGAFSLTGIRPGEQKLSVKLPDGYIFAQDSDADGLSWGWASSQKQDIPWEVLISRTEKQLAVARPAVISGTVWMDEDRDASRAENEWIYSGLKLELVDQNTGSVVCETVSTEEGYRFDSVRPGRYAVRFALPEQASPAGDADSSFRENGENMLTDSFEIAEGETLSDLDTGLVSTTSLGGSIYLDETGSRSPVAGATVELLSDGSRTAKTATAEDGSYRFDGLWPGAYQIRVTLPYGAIFVRESDNAYAAEDTVIHAESGSTAESGEIKLQMAQHQLDLNVLCIKPGMVGDIAWLDENANGLVDGQEARIPGVLVQLVQNGTVMYETATDSSGYYLFSGVYPGSYVLRAQACEALAPTEPVPELRIISSCLTSGDGVLAQSDEFTVQSGEKNMNFDLGYVLRDGYELPSLITGELPGRDWTSVNEAERVILSPKR